MTDWIFDEAKPNSRVCILLGRVDSAEITAACARYGCGVLWMVDREGFQKSGSAEHPQLFPCMVEDLNAEQVDFLLNEFLVRDCSELPDLKISRAVLEIRPAAYEFLIERVQTLFVSARRARLTRSTEGFSWQRNLLKNLPAYFSRRLPMESAGALRGMPALIVGAGPSLDRSLPHLLRWQENLVIFAADSALRTLHAAGIHPDFTINVDSIKLPETCCPEGFSPGRLILTAMGDPRWLSVQTPSRWILPSRVSTFDWLAKLGVRKSPFEAGNNCGLVAVQISHFLGCSPIFLAGMDMAVDAKDPAKTHAAQYQGDDKTKAALATVPGNYQERVGTRMQFEWEETCRSIEEISRETLVVNITDSGARLAGARLLHPAQAASFLLERLEGAIQKSIPMMIPAGKAESARKVWAKIGAISGRALAKIRAHRDGPVAEQGGLRQLLTGLYLEPDFAALLGAYSLTAMQHLVENSENEDAEFLQILLETEQLCLLAQEQAESQRSESC